MSALKPVTFKTFPADGVTVTSVAGNEEEKVVAVVKLVELNPVPQEEPGAAAPFCLVSVVPVAPVATALSEPSVAVV